MGLLDFMDSPDAAMGIGLLAAGGPTTDPNQSGFGQRLAAAKQFSDQSRQVKLREELLRSQMAENESQNAARAAQMARQARMDGYYLGGGAGEQPPSMPAATSTGVQPEGAVLKAAVGAPASAPRPAQGKFAEWSQQFNIPVAALEADYISNGGKGIAEMLFKAGRPDMQVVDGYAVDKNRVQPGFLPGITTSADGTSTLRLPDRSAPGGVRVMAPEGALNTARAYSDANNVSKATYTPGRPTILPGGRMGGQSVLDEIGLTAPPRSNGRGDPPASAFALQSDAESAANARSEIGRMSADLASGKVPDAASQKMMRDEIARLTQQLKANPAAASPSPAPAGVAGGGVEFSPIEKAAQKAQEAAAVKQAEADVQPTAGRVQKFTAASDAIGMIDKALKHPGLPTATGLSGAIDPRNLIPGTEAKDFQVLRNQLRGTAFLSAYNELKGGGAITETEGKKAEDAIARLDTAQSEKSFREALGDYRAILDRGMKRAAGTLPQGSVDDLPDRSNPAAKLKAPPSLADLQNTALKYNMTVDQVKQKLGMQ